MSNLFDKCQNQWITLCINFPSVRWSVSFEIAWNLLNFRWNIIEISADILMPTNFTSCFHRWTYGTAVHYSVWWRRNRWPWAAREPDVRCRGNPWCHVWLAQRKRRRHAKRRNFSQVCKAPCIRLVVLQWRIQRAPIRPWPHWEHQYRLTFHIAWTVMW